MDARLEEMKFLSKLAQGTAPASTLVSRQFEDTHFRRMIIHLLQEGYLNDIASVTWSLHRSPVAGYANELEFEWIKKKAHDISMLLNGQEISVSISHKGRVRLAELEEGLKTGRDREPFGILLDGRYCERDISIALLSASDVSPVAVAFLDMNGLKQINDTHGHEAGDKAIKAYFHAVSGVLEGTGEAYRVGGDEVVAVLSGMKADGARSTMLNVIKQLANVKLDGIGKLTTSCGVAIGTNPEEPASDLRARADKMQYDAKHASKTEGRPSALAVEGGRTELV